VTDWEEDDLDEDSWEDVPDDDDESVTLPCPSCGAEVYEDADICPVCGEFIIRSSRVWEDRPVWYVVLGLIGIAAVVLALLVI